ISDRWWPVCAGRSGYAIHVERFGGISRQGSCDEVILASSRPGRLWCSRQDLQRPLIGRDRNTIPTMALNGDGAIRRDRTTDLQLLVDSAPSLIHTGRPDGDLDFFNQTWLRYVGRSLEDLQGWKWTAFIHPDDVEGIVEKWRA